MERAIARTPSLTPTELEEINAPLYDLARWKRKETWMRWKVVPWLVLATIVAAGVTFITVYNKQIITFIRPAADWMHTRSGKYGWLIPVALFFVLSFPPLFGHGIIAIVCGLVWGLGVGFGITCFGTLLGEIGNYYAFKHCCRARAEKIEQTKPYYACLAKVVREGGFKVALIARLSALPAHFTTAVFATCGMGIWTFILAAILSLPKQFVIVYVGVILDDESNKDDTNAAQHKDNTAQKIISDLVAALSVIVTIAALWWLNRELKRVKPTVMAERRRGRLAAMRRQGSDPEMAMAASTSNYSPETILASRPAAMPEMRAPEPAILGEDRRLHVM